MDLLTICIVPDLIESLNRTANGVPIGRPAQVNLRNNHLQYIFTWYALCSYLTSSQLMDYLGTVCPWQRQSCFGWLFANALMRRCDEFARARTCRSSQLVAHSMYDKLV